VGLDRGQPSPSCATTGRRWVAALVLVPALLGSGCIAVVGTGAAVAATSYLGNGLSRSFHADPDTVWVVSQEALRLEGYRVPRIVSREDADNRIVCLSSSARDVIPRETQVWIEPGAPGFTRVHVRVGMFETADSIRDAERVLLRIEETLRGQG
jgi:hypothetical protein